MLTNLLNGFGTPKEPYHLLALRSAKEYRGSGAAKQGVSRDFPAYIVDVTRNTLLSFTTSLTKSSSQVHDFFSTLNQYLAFERMMRTCFGWAMPAARATSTLGMPQWPMPNWFSPVPRQPKHNALFWWGADWFMSPKPRSASTFVDVAMTAAGLPVHGALLAMPAAFLSLAPAMMQAWGFPG
jgi:hypothetical protein